VTPYPFNEALFDNTELWLLTQAISQTEYESERGLSYYNRSGSDL